MVPLQQRHDADQARAEYQARHAAEARERLSTRKAAVQADALTAQALRDCGNPYRALELASGLEVPVRDRRATTRPSCAAAAIVLVACHAE